MNGLTKLQQETWEDVCRGLNTAGAARKRDVPLDTVKSRRAALYRKLGVDTALQAAAVYIELLRRRGG